jgi:hypothetical protein
MAASAETAALGHRSTQSQRNILGRLHKDAVVVSDVAVQLAILDTVLLRHLSPVQQSHRSNDPQRCSLHVYVRAKRVCGLPNMQHCQHEQLRTSQR